MRTFVGVPWVNNPGLLYKTVASLTASAHLELDIRLVGNGPTLQDSIQARGMVNGFQLRKSTLPHQIQGVSWMPSLPSLAAVWNTLLVTAWTEGYDKAVLCNPDLQVHPESLDVLLKVQRDTDAMVCTGIAVDEMPQERPTGAVNPKGSGPSYSLFVITKLCHELYPFDPNFTPAYCEDVDHHRRMLLGGDGRRSFAIDVPFFHVGSGTLNSMSEERRAQTEQRITMGSRRYYAEKWGGPVNEEQYRTSFNLEAQDDGPRDGPTTTPDLFREAWNG